MTDKERLTNIIHNAQNKYLNLLKFESSILADHLLANGVIVPPCKVGDKVYMATPNGNIRETIIIEINTEQSRYETKINISGVYEVDELPFFTQILTDNFGKTVFLTKEEAEEKLNELNKGE